MTHGGLSGHTHRRSNALHFYCMNEHLLLDECKGVLLQVLRTFHFILSLFLIIIIVVVVVIFCDPAFKYGMSLRQPLFSYVSYSIWSVEKVDKLASVLLYCPYTLCSTHFYRIFVCVVFFVCCGCVSVFFINTSFQQFILFPLSPFFFLFVRKTFVFFKNFFHFPRYFIHYNTSFML